MTQDLSGLPLPLRCAFVASIAGVAIGAIGGLVLGLDAYAPTAPFAVIEGGVLAGVAGLVAGLAVGVLAAITMHTARRIKQRNPSSP